jgi:hypothetical protein
MSMIRQGWRNARLASSAGRLVHAFLPEDPDEAMNVIAAMGSSQHQSAHRLAADAGEYDHARLADIASEDGYSHHPIHGKGPSEGWMASYEAPEGSGIGQVHRMADMTAGHVAAHREAISEHLTKPNTYQGAWHDKSDGNVYLDVSKHFPEEHKEKAFDFAADEKQKAVFHLKDFSTHYLDPHQDPDREEDHDEWSSRYGGNTAAHPRYHEYSHLYPDTESQAASRPQMNKGAMRGIPVHPGQAHSPNRRPGWADQFRGWDW